QNIIYTTMASYLPQDAGFLPWFLLFNTVLSWGNTIQCFLAPTKVKELYAGPNGASQVTNLSAHTFGCWTILSDFVRFYAAYNITNPQVYALAFWAYVAILFHWTTELLVYHTTKIDAGNILNFLIDGGGLVWTFCQ
ncbi:hypothetical protein V1508DRAFT_354850, partial [Lipomyces doorenjongii]|uniref:uncharacterized protein n=1 Tax=Lipomyces doorenjongii TaxID=383834 RepID=UPI0034CDAC6F